MLLSHDETLFNGTDITASSNSRSSPVITRWSKEAVFFLDITAVSGTNPTLAVTIDIYDVTTEKWGLFATFNTATSVSFQNGFVGDVLGDRLAISYVIGGTNTPKFSFTASVNLKDES